MQIIDYEKERVVKVDGIQYPDYTLREQLLMRIAVWCSYNDAYKHLTMPQAIEKYNEDHLGDHELLEGKAVDPDEIYDIAQRFTPEWQFNIIHAPCGQYPLGNGEYTIYDPSEDWDD